MDVTGENWSRALAVPRFESRLLSSASIPTSRGIYIWFHEGKPVYIGEAKGKRGLRQRLGAHRATTTDLSRSTLRASVAVAQLGVTRQVARQRPSAMTVSQVSVVNDWLGGCEIGWIECASASEAHALETALRAEWLPPLNRL